MKKILLLSLFLLSVLLNEAMAQSRTITGRVTDAETGEGMPGVTVQLKGASIAAPTDVNGAYTISVPNAGGTLVFSFIGYTNQEISIGNQSTINVRLATDARQLAEVVITGVSGTTRTQRATTSNAQVINSEQLNVIRQPNVNNALAGKVSGIQVRSQSAAALGRETEVRLRGASGFASGSGALYIVDGTILPNADDINQDDIESVSVLQGPAASAQFGAQAANGAIVITTKKGRKTEGAGVTLNLGAMFENVYIMPNYQNSYAGGASSDLIQYRYKAGDPEGWKALDGKYYHDYSDDASWGPRMVGQEYIPWYAWYEGHSRSFQTTSLDPQPDNSRDFFNTGVTWNNSVSFTTATDALKLRMSYGNQNTKGLIPNSKMDKHTLNLAATYDINKHFQVGANINYIRRTLDGEINDDYSNQSTGSFSQWFHRDLDMDIMKELRGLRTPDGIYASWNHANPTSYKASDPRSFYAANYWYNFYTYYDLVDLVNQRDRLFGNLSLTYKLNDNFKVSGTYRKQQNTVFSESKYSSRLNESGLQTTGNSPTSRGYYGTSTSYSNRENIEFLASFNKRVGDFSIDTNLGSDFFTWVSKSNGASTNNGLNIPDLFTVTNSVDNPTISNDRVEEQYRAIFLRATLGYKNLLFLDGTLRNDWYSTLPEEENDVLSKSFGASFVFSDLVEPVFPWLSNGKLRASWGEIPKALGTTNETFGAYRYPGNAYGLGQFKWGSNFLMSRPDILVDPNIRGSVSSQAEVGVDLGFLNNRFTASATYWEGKEKDFPYLLSLNGATGYSNLLTNIGEISKKGMEFQVGATPVERPNFTWTINATWSPLIENDIVELSKEYNITRTNTVGGVWGGANVPLFVHEEGKRWGQLIGGGMKKINGQPVLTSAGLYVSDPNTNFGSVLPKHTGGVQNSFNIFRDFSLNVNIDYQVGGKFVSLSNIWGTYSGLTARTASVNDKGNSVRDAVADGGGVHVKGVNADGEPVDYYVEGQTYFQQHYLNQVYDDFVYDLTFVKVRELAIGYRIPVQRFGLSKYIQGASFSLVSRNPLLLYSKTPDFDPSEIDAIYGETGQLPGTRGIGFNLRVEF